VLPKLESFAQPREWIAALKLIGFTDGDLAEATASSESTVAKWRSSTVPGPAARIKIDQVRAVVLYLITNGIAPAGAYGWVTGVDPELDWKRPIALVRDGDFDRVTRRLKDIAPHEPLRADDASTSDRPSDDRHEVAI
jgi:hypothetical protein